ncbi:MAG: hypothetical protein HQ504_08650 [Rhodospirillaceae bacterium]|nr:hypothetical protein [Rhodospirillaceae bacterium]
MRSCVTCPGAGTGDCAGTNLHPVLGKVLELYGDGMTDKFDILFALGSDAEKLLERYTYRVSPDCWSRASLLAIADALVAGGAPEDTIRTAKNAFALFPWRLEELVEQAPDLYQAVLVSTPDDSFEQAFSKRAFVKICKQVAYE